MQFWDEERRRRQAKGTWMALWSFITTYRYKITYLLSLLISELLIALQFSIAGRGGGARGTRASPSIGRTKSSTRQRSRWEVWSYDQAPLCCAKQGCVEQIQYFFVESVHWLHTLIWQVISKSTAVVRFDGFGNEERLPYKDLRMPSQQQSQGQPLSSAPLAPAATTTSTANSIRPPNRQPLLQRWLQRGSQGQYYASMYYELDLDSSMLF